MILQHHSIHNCIMRLTVSLCLALCYGFINCEPCSTCGCSASCPKLSPGLYQIVLDNCGPNPSPACPVNAPPACAPAIEKPIVSLPACIPPPKIVGASASCVKTILKPQLFKQLVSVPIISKYLQTVTKPQIEVITFNAQPMCPARCPQPACLPPSPPAYCPLPPPACLPPPLPAYCPLSPPACPPPVYCPPPPPVCLPPPPPACLPPPPPACLPPPPPVCCPSPPPSYLQFPQPCYAPSPPACLPPPPPLYCSQLSRPCY